MSSSSFLLAIVALVHAGCGSSADSSSKADALPRIRMDGSFRADALVEPDAAEGDAGAADTGVARDGSSGGDAGSVADGSSPIDGSSPVDGSSTVDSGNVVDGGPSPVDGSSPLDTGGSADAVSFPDAAQSDAGAPPADAGQTGDTVSFVVHVPAGTPAYEGVFISGSDPALGTWDGHGIALQRMSEGLWTGSVALPAGMHEYKATRGTWATVEKAANGSEIANRSVTVAGATNVEITVARWADQPSVTGKVESLGTFTSAFRGPRPVLVYLPPSYDSEPARRFPVLYLHDGQNMFDRRTAFGGSEWAADEAAEQLINAGQVSPLIMVAVGNTAERIADYTPTMDSQNGGGSADQYARLLIEELKPAIDARYRTLTDAANTGVLGSSLGGLVSMYFGITHSDVFHRIGAVSPSVWWDNRVIVQRVQALPGLLPLKVWLDIGTSEGSGSAVTDARALRDALVQKGWQLNVDLNYVEVNGGMHNEAAWRARFPDMLRYLYPP